MQIFSFFVVWNLANVDYYKKSSNTVIFSKCISLQSYLLARSVEQWPTFLI